MRHVGFACLRLQERVGVLKLIWRSFSAMVECVLLELLEFAVIMECARVIMLLCQVICALISHQGMPFFLRFAIFSCLLSLVFVANSIHL